MLDDEKRRRRAKNKKERAKQKEFLQRYADDLLLLRNRCQSQLTDALELLDVHQISFEKFMSNEFDCRQCPMFMVCSVAQLFSDHPKDWKFQWMENL